MKVLNLGELIAALQKVVADGVPPTAEVHMSGCDCVGEPSRVAVAKTGWVLIEREDGIRLGDEEKAK